MPQSYYFHIRPQQASVLLGPICDDLERLENRLRHYAEHIRLSDEDTEKMRQAADAVAGALATVRDLRAGSREAL